jgi:hypothetical protein
MANNKFIDETGNQYGYLIVLEQNGRYEKSGAILWRCRCKCKNIIKVTGHSLRSGNTGSCGCRRAENAAASVRVHGMYSNEKLSPEFHSWNGIRRRCYGKTSADYKDYGGRGITVCDRWLGPQGFQNFLADMGTKPSPSHSLDRWPNNDGNYEPSNCRWATPKEQVENRRIKRIEKFTDEELLKEVARRNLKII